MGRGKLGGGGDLRGDQRGKGEGGVGRSRYRYLYLDLPFFFFAFHDNNMHISVSRRVHVIMQDKKKKQVETYI